MPPRLHSPRPAPSGSSLLFGAFLAAVACGLASEPTSIPSDDPAPSPLAELPEIPTHLGPNEARGARAAAFSWSGESPSDAAARAVDGDPATAWTAAKPGPASWRVDLGSRRTLSAVAILWQNPPSSEVLLEISSGEDAPWKELARWQSGGRGDPLSLLAFAPTEAARLRLTIAATAPGEVIGIREFAAYVSPQAIPSAILRRFPSASPSSSPSPESEAAAPFWQAIFEIPVEIGGEPVQLIPTASGDLFLSVFPNEGPGKVMRVGPAKNADDAAAPLVFLDGLEPGVRIAWDGEWLLTLLGGRLDRVRCALGSGRADERGLSATVFLPSGSGEDPPEIRDFRLGPDGWLYALVHATPGAVLRDRDGRSLSLSGSCVLRFRRDGGGLAVVSRAPSDAARLDLGGFGAISFSPSRLPAEAAGLAAAAFPLAGERDGDLLWIAARAGDGLRCLLFAASPAPEGHAPNWDKTPLPGILDHLATAKRPSIRREGALELLRRKTDPLPGLERALAASSSPEEAESLVAALAGLPEPISRPRLERLAEAGATQVKAAALLALAGLDGARNHPGFLELGRSTEPLVTAAAFRAILLSGSGIDGDEALALELIDHPDPLVADAAQHFLAEREAVDLVFSAIERDGEGERWPSLFALLPLFTVDSVVSRLAEDLERTRRPRFRRKALGILCQLHRRADAGTALRLEGILGAALRDHRVDRPALLRDLAAAEGPLPDAKTLVALAREDLSLEAFVVGRLRVEGGDIGPGTRAWLAAVAQDSSRDEALRRAASEMAGLAPPPLERSSPAGVGELEGGVAGSGAGLFARASCLECHGPEVGQASFLPDFAATVAAMDDEDLRARLSLAPGADDSSAKLVEFLDGAGLRLFGMVEARDSGGVRLRDRAGNPFRLQAGEIGREVGEVGPFARCHEAAGLGEEALRALISHLRELADE